MKKIVYSLIIVSSIFFISCQNDISEFNSDNLLKRNATPLSQSFNIGLVKDTVIIGDYHTKIYFNRKDYKISNTDSITITLKELYDFESILFNQISTITDENELLETSGVFFLEIKSGEEVLEHKKGKRTKIELPIKKYASNRIFKAKIDSMQMFQWSLEDINAQIVYPDTIKNRLFKISNGYNIVKIVSVDSIGYYENIIEQWNNRNDDLLKIDYATTQIKLLLKDFGWYNIDKFVYDTNRINFTVDIIDPKPVWYNSYLIYDSINSIISNIHHGKSLQFDSIPFRNNMSLVITTEKDSTIYFNKIILNEKVNNYKAKLLETNLEELKKELKN